jgi:hypothetical protein
MNKIKAFNWVPNHDEAHSKIEYVFIELSVFHFYCETMPGSSGFAKLDENKEWMKQAVDVWMPIIHFNQYQDDLNKLEFFQGRHRTISASKFSDANSKIVIMIEKNGSMKLSIGSAVKFMKLFQNHILIMKAISSVLRLKIVKNRINFKSKLIAERSFCKEFGNHL